jgi:hypothetical protein
VNDILNISTLDKIDRAEQTSEKLSVVSDLIRSGSAVNTATINTLINVLTTQNSSPVPQNSKEEELY